jgi:vacuolar protein sorting-associated protein 13A/C
LVVKIPWSNLYGAAVEATIEGLYLLLAPNNQVEYNAEKEEQREYDAKLAELQKIDDRKKLEEGSVKCNLVFSGTKYSLSFICI